MRIGFYQFAPHHGKKELNLKRVESALQQTNADLVVLPEMCLTGYLFGSRAELAESAEPVPDGPSCDHLSKVCRESNAELVFGIAEKAGDRLYNSAVLLTPHGDVHVYRKSHLFLDEKDFFAPGDMPFPVFDVDGVRIGMLVCFDYFFPEAARILALNGAQIICHPSNLVLDFAQ